MDKFGISDVHLKQITKVISSFPSVTRALIFGSRAKGNYKKYSDVDICLFGEIDAFCAEKVREALNELGLIYEFDVISYNETKSAELLEHIDRVGLELYK